MKERRSEKRKSDLFLKKILIIPRLRIPRGWVVTLTGETFAFAFKGTQPGNQPNVLNRDPYLARKKFLSIKTTAQALAFFKEFGPFVVQSDRPGEDLPPGAAGIAPKLSFAALIDKQDFYRKVLLKPKYWTTVKAGIDGFREFASLNFLRSPKITVEIGGPPFLLMESAYVSQAIYSTFYLDWIRDLKSVECRECGKIVRQDNQHVRYFCPGQCGPRYRKKQWKKRQLNKSQ